MNDFFGLCRRVLTHVTHPAAALIPYEVKTFSQTTRLEQSVHPFVSSSELMGIPEVHAPFEPYPLRSTQTQSLAHSPAVPSIGGLGSGVGVVESGDSIPELYDSSEHNMTAVASHQDEQSLHQYDPIQHVDSGMRTRSYSHASGTVPASFMEPPPVYSFT
jgi:hypothetical protein